MKKYYNTRYFLLFLFLSLQVTRFINTGIVYNNSSNISAGDQVHIVEMLKNKLKKMNEPAKITGENTPKPEPEPESEPKLVKITKKNILKSKPKSVEITKENTTKPKVNEFRFKCVFSTDTSDLNRHVKNRRYDR